MDPATELRPIVAPTVVGGLFGRSAAKKDRAAQSQAQQMNANDAISGCPNPNILDLYRRGQNALNDQLGTGFYQGQTRAGL